MMTILFARVSARYDTTASGNGKNSKNDGETAWVVAAARVEPASDEVRVGSDLDGRLDSVLVREGDVVQHGQLLAVISNNDMLAEIAAAEAELEAKLAAYRRLLNGSSEQEREEGLESVKEADAVLLSAESRADRLGALSAEGLASRLDLETAQRDLAVAMARRNGARQRFSLLVAPPLQEDRDRMEAEIKLARARVLEARARLDKTMIRSPATGTVLRRFRNAGESVSPASSQPIVSIADLSDCVAKVGVDETDISKIRIGQQAYIVADAYGKKRFWGEVIRQSRRVGRKIIQTDDPAEREDEDVLEVSVGLSAGCVLPIGLRAMAYIRVDSGRLPN